ncbi:MAG: hypothetical protein HLUCCA13_13900 [Halomonas sp. HL-48]|nr:MAG: hypothetical protein HLUCCA13_13900 [Halomonas sp. HL-48]
MAQHSELAQRFSAVIRKHQPSIPGNEHGKLGGDTAAE